VASLRANEVDMIAVPPPDSVASLQQSGFQVSEGAPPHVWFLSFNFTDPIMKNKLVRQAINLAIDRQGMATNLLKDTVKTGLRRAGPGERGVRGEHRGYGYNPDKAKQLLAQAGYPTVSPPR